MSGFAIVSRASGAFDGSQNAFVSWNLIRAVSEGERPCTAATASTPFWKGVHRVSFTKHIHTLK